MRRASSSRLTSPSTEEAVPPAFAICSTRLSTPPQFVSRSPGALCSLATPAGRTSETTTAMPLAASARAVELPMPIGLPQPVISATRDEWGMGVLPSSAVTLLSSRRRPGSTGQLSEQAEEWVPAFAGTTVLALQKMRAKTIRLHRACAFELRAVHQAAGRGIKGVAPVHRTAIVPPDEVARLPILPPREFLLGCVLPQEIEELLALTDRQAEDIGVDAPAEEQRLAPGLGMGADQRLHRPRHFRHVIYRLEPLMRPAAAVVGRGVARFKPADPGFDVGRQRFIGRIHVEEIGRAARRRRRAFQGAQQAGARRQVNKRRIRIPERFAIAEPANRLAVLDDVGD